MPVGIYTASRPRGLEHLYYQEIFYIGSDNSLFLGINVMMSMILFLCLDLYTV